MAETYEIEVKDGKIKLGNVDYMDGFPKDIEHNEIFDLAIRLVVKVLNGQNGKRTVSVDLVNGKIEVTNG